MGSTSTNKGKRYERQIAAELTEVGFPAKRALNETRDGNTGDLDLEVPIVVGARHRKAVSVWEAVRDVVEAAGDSGKLAVAIVKRTAFRTFPGQEVAAMPKADFYRLLGMARVALEARGHLEAHDGRRTHEAPVVDPEGDLPA